MKKHITREKLLAITAGKFWLYPEIWPLLKPVNTTLLNRIALSANPVQQRPLRGKELLLFDDTGNPTLSYKDRATSLVAAKALELGITEIAAASTGNAGSSLAGICARLGIKTHLFCPARVPSGKRLQIQSFGSTLYLVDGSYDDAFDLSMEISREKHWYNRNTAYNPLTIEGKKSSAFDMFIAMQGNVPDNIFIPTGDGVIISGIYKGFADLLACGLIDKLPKLMAVQAEGSDAVCRYSAEGVFNFIPSDTKADSISAGAPRNLYMAAYAVKESEGACITVSDDEIFAAQKTSAREFGMLIEPAAAASLAGYTKYLSQNSLEGTAMLMFTGNGLKDIAALEQWNELPGKKTVPEWQTYFNK
ncbi:MAG: pyridoxal-phosphate dependent enzyme [Ignavibacteriales bacterium]|nr:pyridoxal-phosphate dependent enzyme [Ignavibacteriales bacterium]